MRTFLSNISYKLQRMMQGRYGFDELSKKMITISVVLFVIYMFLRINTVYFAAALLVVLAYIRCFSRNFHARSKELQSYFKIKNKISTRFSLFKRMYDERKTYRYFKCKKCKAILRLPKGRGKVEITCSVCKNKIIKKV